MHRQTVEFGVKGRAGPSLRVTGHVRWAGAGLGEGGGALHTDPVLAGQVLVIWGGGREGGGRREVGEEGAHSPAARRLCRRCRRVRRRVVVHLVGGFGVEERGHVGAVNVKM